MLDIVKKAGYTLIELIVVIAIIGALAGTGIMGYSNSLQKGRDAQRKSSLKGIQAALEQYYNDHKRYPISAVGASSNWWCDNDGLSPWLNDSPGTYDTASHPLDSGYITLPQDPKFNTVNTGSGWNGGKFGICYYSGPFNSATPGQSYILGVALENTGDPDLQASAHGQVNYGNGPFSSAGVYLISNQ